jgi:putative membrane protein
MKTHLIFLCGLLAFSACTKKVDNDSKELAEDQNEEKFEDSKVEDDTEFAVAAADGGLLEVKLGELAIANAASPEIKKFGQSMVDDHGKANLELKGLAEQKQITIPTTLSDRKQEKYDELSQKKGAEFDEAYAEFMVKDHKDDIDAFKKEAEKGNDADLKAWAAGKVPVLEHHLMMAEAAEKAVKDKK